MSKCTSNKLEQNRSLKVSFFLSPLRSYIFLLDLVPQINQNIKWDWHTHSTAGSLIFLPHSWFSLVLFCIWRGFLVITVHRGGNWDKWFTDFFTTPHLPIHPPTYLSTHLFTHPSTHPGKSLATLHLAPYSPDPSTTLCVPHLAFPGFLGFWTLLGTTSGRLWEEIKGGKRTPQLQDLF